MSYKDAKDAAAIQDVINMIKGNQDVAKVGKRREGGRGERESSRSRGLFLSMPFSRSLFICSCQTAGEIEEQQAWGRDCSWILGLHYCCFTHKPLLFLAPFLLLPGSLAHLLACSPFLPRPPARPPAGAGR